MYKVKLTRSAEKSFASLAKSHPHLARRVSNAIDHLALNPEIGVPLRGDLKGLWKYRVGSYRLIYEIHRGRLLVVVIDIDHRKDVYR